MRRKYIKRSSDTHDKHGGISAEDEWAHITEIGPKIEDKDILDVQERSIYFRKEKSDSKGGLEDVREEARYAVDSAGNTGQYIKFVNAHLEKQNSQIKRIKRIKEDFDREVEILQAYNSKSIPKKMTKFRDKKELVDMFQSLLLEKGITKSKLNNLKSDILAVENELMSQENEIEKVSDELKLHNIKAKPQNSNSLDESTLVKIIRGEIDGRGMNYDVKKLAEALAALESALKRD